MFSLTLIAIVLLFTGCATTAGNWEDYIPETVATSYNSIYMTETGGIYTNYLPIKLAYNFGEDVNDGFYTLTYTPQAKFQRTLITAFAGFGYHVDKVTISNSQGKSVVIRSLKRNEIFSEMFGIPTDTVKGYEYTKKITVEEANMIRDIVAPLPNLDYVHIQGGNYDSYIYNATLPALTAIKYFFSQVDALQGK